jgi:photosystem II stability/assembly factor-like uncharacterized protein
MKQLLTLILTITIFYTFIFAQNKSDMRKHFPSKFSHYDGHDLPQRRERMHPPLQEQNVNSNSISTYNTNIGCNAPDGFSCWQWLNPLPQGNTLNDIWAFDSLTAIAVGDVGTIIKTTNGGINWSVLHGTWGASLLSSIYFVNSDTGWIVGGHYDSAWVGIILKTTDRGTNWTSQTISLSSWNSWCWLNSVYFLDSNLGWAVGEYGSIIKTTDGGSNWSNLTSYDIGIHLQSVFFIDSNTGFSVGDFHIYKTTNGGLNWTQVGTGNAGWLQSVYFIDFNTGWAVGESTVPGENGNILKTIDGGITWINQPIMESYQLYSVRFINSNTGWAVGSNYDETHGAYYGLLLKTTNGGTDWTSQTIGINQILSSVFFINSTRGWAVGKSGIIFKSTDGGTSWSSKSGGTSAELHSICFIDSNTGWTVGSYNTWHSGYSNYGLIMKTTDGGSNWESRTMEQGNELYSVYFADANTGWAVGSLYDIYNNQSGLILKTTNGGVNWTSTTIGIGELYSVFFKDHNIGWVAGNNEFYKTTDGGTNWISVSFEPATSFFYLQSIYFINSSTGWIIGNSFDNTYTGFILKTTDGGINWNSKIIQTDFHLYSIDFTNSNIGYVVGRGNKLDNNGIILKTTDGGETWIQRIGQNYLLRSVNFADANKGIAVGDIGTIQETSDGGITWNQVNSPTLNSLFNIKLIRSGNGWVGYSVGEGGAILYTSLSPLNPKTWSGAIDSLWNNPDNWSPSGVPLPGDSIIIASTTHNPVINQTQQRISIAHLTILSDATLTITDALAELAVNGDVQVYGTLELRPPAQTSITLCGNWIVEPGGNLKTKDDRGFIPGYSTVNFTGSGTFSNNFFNVVFDSASSMSSNGNVRIENTCYIFDNVNLQSEDTLFIQGNEPQALFGKRKILQGTIKRTVHQHTTEPYQFESQKTFVQFDTVGTQPQFVSMTSYPNTNPTGFGTAWFEISSHIDTLNNVITADSVTEFSKWSIKPPGLFTKNGSEFVRRVYSVKQEGGQNFRAKVSFRYEQSEVPAGMDESTLRLFRLPDSAVSVSSSTNALPKEFALYQNYPNPFNPMTKIKFDLPSDAVVTLKIYNIVGEEVKSILNNALYNAGRKEVEFNSSALSSGIYFYRLVAINGKENFSSVKKMVVVK